MRGGASAAPRALRQSDRDIDRDDGGLLRSGEDLGKPRHNTQANLTAGGSHESDQPAGWTTVSTRDPSVVRGFARHALKWHGLRRAGRRPRSVPRSDWA